MKLYDQLVQNWNLNLATIIKRDREDDSDVCLVFNLSDDGSFAATGWQVSESDANDSLNSLLADYTLDENWDDYEFEDDDYEIVRTLPLNSLGGHWAPKLGEKVGFMPNARELTEPDYGYNPYMAASFAKGFITVKGLNDDGVEDEGGYDWPLAAICPFSDSEAADVAKARELLEGRGFTITLK